MIKVNGQNLAAIRQWLDANRVRRFEDTPDRVENGWGQGDVLAAHEELYAATSPVGGKLTDKLAASTFDLPLSLTAEMLAGVILGPAR